MSNALIGIDLGTTRLKVAAFDDSGRLLHQVISRHKETARDGLVWQDADRWWRDTVAATREVVEAIADRTIAGVSLSGRGNAGVFLDARHEVLAHPWSDARHRPYVDELNEWRQGRFLSNYGVALIAKLRWLLDNDASAARIRYACYAKDFLLLRLTGAHRTDWSSGPDREEWGANLLDDLGIPDVLPVPGLPWEIAGGVTDGAAAQIGIEPGTPVAIGAHDGICANVGAGATRVGEYAITLGTHAVTRTITMHPPEGAYRFYTLPPDRHVIGGNALMGGRSADWFLDLVDPDPGHRKSLYALMDTGAASIDSGANGIFFMPFLAGRVSPSARPRASGVFTGLRVSHTREHLFRGVLEGVTFAIRDIFEQIEGWCGEASRTRLTGGGAASTLWPEILANVLNRPLELSDEAVECRGAVIFLAVALGLRSHYDEAADTMVPITRRIEPDATLVGRYDDIRKKWVAVMDITSTLDN